MVYFFIKYQIKSNQTKNNIMFSMILEKEKRIKNTHPILEWQWRKRNVEVIYLIRPNHTWCSILKLHVVELKMNIYSFIQKSPPLSLMPHFIISFLLHYIFYNYSNIYCSYYFYSYYYLFDSKRYSFHV